MSEEGTVLEAEEQRSYPEDLHHITTLQTDCEGLTVWFTDELEQDKAAQLMRTLLYLDSIAGDDEILTVMLCSPGGSVAATLALVDLLKMLTHTVQIIGFGSVCSGAAFLLISADRRYVFPSCQVMLHSPYSYFGDQVLKRRDHDDYLRDMDFNETLIGELINERTNLSSQAVLDGEDHWFRGVAEIQAAGIAQPVTPDVLL